MFESFRRGWALTKTSFRVLKLDKEILLLPILSGLAMVGVIVGAIAFWTLQVDPALAAGNDNATLLGLLGLFAFYVLGYFVVLYFNAAVIECAMIRFNGGDPVVKDGLRKAWSRKGRILQWAIVAAAVSIVFNVLRSMARNQEGIGRIIASMLVWIAEAAWYVVTFFVMPILIYQDVGPIDSLKKSWATVKKSGGEQFVGMFAIGGIFMLAYIATIGLGVLLVFMGTPILPVLAVAIVLVGGLSVVQSALQGIMVAAAYKYVQDGRLPEAMSNAMQAEHVAAPPAA